MQGAQRARRLLEKARGRWANRCIGRAFAGWQEKADAAQRRRTILRKARGQSIEMKEVNMLLSMHTYIHTGTHTHVRINARTCADARAPTHVQVHSHTQELLEQSDKLHHMHAHTHTCVGTCRHSITCTTKSITPRRWASSTLVTPSLE